MPAGKVTSHGRDAYTDIFVDKREGTSGEKARTRTGARAPGAHVEADRDYNEIRRKFLRHDDMAAEPTRDKK